MARFGNVSGRARMNLVASLVLLFLSAGFLATSYFVPQYANAWPTKYSSCVACHATVDATSTIVTAINGTVGTTVSVAAGGSFQVDWKVTGATGAPGQVGLGMEIALPLGWTVAKGTANAPAISGWNSVWDAAGGATGTGWATANKFSEATYFPASPDAYTINYDGTPWDTGTRNAAYDNGSAGDLDGIADNHGADAIVTVPAGTSPGSYSVVVLAVGHEGSTKSYVPQTLAVTVTGGADATKPVVSAGFSATTPSLSRTISVSGFAATDNVAVTGYLISTSSTAPLAGDAGWQGTAPASYTVVSDGPFTLYPWAKDAAGNVSLVYGAPVTVLVDTVLPTVSSTVPTNGTSDVVPDSAVTINFSENVNCATVTTGSVTISPSVTWNKTSCSGSQAVFTPTGQANSTSYTVTVGTGVRDAAGNALASSYPFSYSTEAMAPTAPNVPSPSQYKTDGVTAIAQGGIAIESSVVIKGTVSDANNDNVTLEVELITDGNSFAGAPTCSSGAVASGAVASATCSGLIDGVAYKWRARTNDGALQSAWADFGASNPDFSVSLANTTPPAPSALAQYQADGTTVLAPGAAASSNVVVIGATVDGGNGDQVLLEVDLNNDGTADCASAYVTGPATAQATCAGLADGSYDWRVRAKDAKSAASAWTAYSGTPDFSVATGLDFGIDTTPPTDGSASATSGDGYLNVSWTGATDSGSGLDPVNSYKLVKAAGSSAPADCSGAAIYTGNGTAYFDSAVVNGTTYWYRVCALDEVGNLSAGVTVSGSPSTIALPETAISAPAANAVLTSSPYSITGSAVAGGNPLASVQVSTNNGGSWSAATGSSSWSYAWTLPAEDYVVHTVMARGVDSLGYADATPAQVTIRVDNVAPTGLANSAPANSASNQAISVSLSSTTATDANVSGALQYFFEIATDAGFTTGLQQSGWQTGTSYAPTLASASTYYWHVKARDAAGNVSANTATWSFTTLGSTAPLVPSASQYKTDGVTAIAQGGTVIESGVVIKATVSDPNNDNVSLEVELITNGNSFAGVANCSSSVVPSGSVASATCSGLIDGVAYKWRARTNDGALQSAWAEFGASDPDFNVSVANTTPPAPSDLAQYQADGTTVLDPGAAATTNLVVIGATVDGGNGDQVLLEVDLNNDGTADCASAYVTGPATALATCAGLADGSYDWRVRAKDAKAAASAWTAYSGTPDFTVATGLDFGIDTAAPLDGTVSANSGDGFLNVSWTGATDSDSGLDPVTSYTVVKATGSSAPEDCSGAAIYTGNGTAYFDSAVVNGTIYSYRVCALDRAGNLSAGGTVSGSASAIALAQTAISAPAANAVLTSSPYSITGTAVAGDNPLDSVQVSTNNGSSWDSATGTTSWSYAWTLPAEDYVAHTILAKGVDTLGYADATPAQVTVRVDNVAPAGLAASTPANGATAVATTSALTSTTATDGNTSAAVQYFFELATDSGFSSGVQQSGWQTATSFAPTLNPATTYYWHVGARDAVGNMTAYSATWSFTTGVVAPETTISAPAAASVLTGSPVSITGSATAGTLPLGSVEVSTNNGSSWNSATGTGSWSYSWTLPSEDYVSHTILARALDNAANPDLTPASLSVIVDTVAPTGAANSTPASGATGIAAGSSLVAASASDANGTAPIEYFFEIASDSGFSTDLQQSGWQSGTSFAPALAPTTTYYWHVRARDAAGNTSGYGSTTSFTTAAATVLVGQGTGESNVTLAPGAAQTALDAFTLQVGTGTDTVTSVTVTLANGSYAGIGTIAITDGSTSYGSVANPSSNTVLIPLTTNITVTGTATQYLVEIQPKSHAEMPAVPGSSYAVTGTVTAIASSNPKAYNDSASATVTIDNLSPTNVTGAGGTAGSAQNSLTWSNPAVSDFAEVVVLRRVDSAVADTPVEGTSYLADNVIGSSTVAYAGSDSGFTDVPLVNDTVYYYKIFAKDSRGNYSSGGTAVGPLVPAKPWANNPMLHNSSNLGSTKWSGNGGWGEPGKKYGAFTCTTCHNQSTANIKRTKSSISTPDGSTWGSNGATSVAVSAANPGTDYGNDGAHATSSRICEVCHSQTSFHKYNQTALTHNGTVNCTSECHLHSKGFKGQGGDCTGCHAAAKNDTANADIGNDGTRIIVAEFSRVSHHVTGVAITKEHCTMCHMEGNAAGAGVSSQHQNGQIDLRNVDTNTALVWTGSEHSNVDNFCLACHDGDGVANATVRAIVPGATATDPFNDTLTNGYDQVARPGVLNVKAQFAAGNFSHHAVSTQRYTSSTPLFNASLFVSTFTPLGAAQTVRDTSTLHCGDCHTVGQWSTVGGIGGHGSTNEYLLQTSNGANTEHTATTYVCYKCHVSSTYSAATTHADNTQDYYHSSTGTGVAGRAANTGNITGILCANCHNCGATGWGGIHGGNTTYVDGGGATQNTYRFMPGMANSKYQPGSWSAASATGCYTGPQAGWGSCDQHSGSAKPYDRAVTRSTSY